MIKVVFDTNVILQAILSEFGPARSCLRFVLQGFVLLITTQETVDELVGVISRPSLLRKYPQLREPMASELVLETFGKAKIVDSPNQIFELDRDVEDEVFINLAVEHGADYLVSRDRDLLDLMDDADFRERFPDLKIVTPIGFLESVRAN